MTIKEIEELTRMSRANIRFYEAEGFITPARSQNGYRDYSLEDAEILKKIKLLRSLHISLEEIKRLHDGKQNLSDTLNVHITRLTQQKNDLDNVGRICSSMKQDGASYQNLDTEKYWNAFSYIADSTPEELSQDTIPPVRAPWRRFFARTLDEVLYTFLWKFILILGFRVNINNIIANMGIVGIILEIAICLILTIFLEPLQLSLFGTTFGKGILGLSVRDNNDRKLTYNAAMSRTCQVLWHGNGLNLPFLDFYRNWKSWNICITYNTLPWEYDSILILKDEKTWRTAVYIAVRISFLLTFLAAGLYIQSPPKRGELTIKEFCQNYRHLEKYYNMDSSQKLNDKGQWHVRKKENDGIIIYVESLYSIEEQQDFEFKTDESNHIDSVCFTLEYSASAEENDLPAWLPDCQEQMILSTLAFIGAQDDFHIFSSDSQKLIKKISTQPFQDFKFTFADVTVTCDFESKGLVSPAPSSDMIFPQENQDIYYKLHFSLEK